MRPLRTRTSLSARIFPKLALGAWMPRPRVVELDESRLGGSVALKHYLTSVSEVLAPPWRRARALPAVVLAQEPLRPEPETPELFRLGEDAYRGARALDRIDALYDEYLARGEERVLDRLTALYADECRRRAGRS